MTCIHCLSGTHEMPLAPARAGEPAPTCSCPCHGPQHCDECGGGLADGYEQREGDEDAQTGYREVEIVCTRCLLRTDLDWVDGEIERRMGL